MKYNITIETSSFSMDDARDMKLRFKDEQEDSWEKWSVMDDDFKSALLKSVKYGLEQMHHRADEWVPYCMLTGIGGDKIEVRLAMLLSDIESQANLETRVSDFEVKDTKRKLEKVLSGDSDELDEEDFMKYVEEAISNGRKITVKDTKRLTSMVGDKS